jgi:hypothetical protein
MEADNPTSSKYPPMSPQERAQLLNVPLSQRLKPDLSAAVPVRFVTLEEAKEYDESWCYDPSLGECRYHHLAARRTANTQICADCERVKKGLDPIYGKSVVNKHYPAPRRAAKDPSAPGAPAAPVKAELPKKDQDIVTALAETFDFDKAAAAVGCSRAQLDARLAVSEPLRKIVDELVDRLGIARTRASTASGSEWTFAKEEQLTKAFINSGLLVDARKECGVTASDFFEHMESSPTFAAMIDAARPKAREVLKDIATRAAAVGDVNLLKHLEKDAEEGSIAGMSVEQMHAEIERLLKRFDSMGLFPNEMWHRVTGQLIDFRDLEYAQPDSSNQDLVST